MASIYEKDGRLYARFKDAAGRWRHRKTACKTKRDAQRFAEDLERQAERQRNGLEPLPGDAPKMTFGELYAWWWADYGSKRRGRRNDDADHFARTRLAPLWGTPLMEVSAAKIEGVLAHADGLGPATLNKLRALIHAIFAKASKRAIWGGLNPASNVDRRKVPKKIRPTLRAEEVPVLLMHLDRRWRALFACAVWTGCRKGELLGLQKRSVNLDENTITVERSYDAETTKGGHASVIPIAADLRPWLVQAIGDSKTELVFPAPDGEMYPDDLALQDVLRRALGRAGIVDSYTNRCRRKGCGFTESTREASRRPCPKCGFRLWVKPIPKPLRFHDLRGTTATLLARSGAPLVVAQRILRHKDPALTANIYTQIEIGDLRSGLDGIEIPDMAKVMEKNRADRFVATLSPATETGKDEARDPRKTSEEPRASMVGATGFEPATTCTPNRESAPYGVAGTVTASQAHDIIERATRANPHSERNDSESEQGFVAPLSPVLSALPALPEQLMTIAEVAARLRVCKATVYKLASTGALRTVRIGEAVRVHPDALAAFVALKGRT